MTKGIHITFGNTVTGEELGMNIGEVAGDIETQQRHHMQAALLLMFVCTLIGAVKHACSLSSLKKINHYIVNTLLITSLIIGVLQPISTLFTSDIQHDVKSA